MARLFRLYEKKRGDRRTGSKQFGRLGEAAFFGLFLLVGCAALVALLYTLVIPEWRANRHFLETTGRVLDARVSRIDDSEGNSTYRPDIRIEYTVDGNRYEDVTYDAARWYSSNREEVEATVESFPAGSEHACWYDPMDPSHAILVRGYSGWYYLFLLIPLSFIVIGGGGLIYTLLHWNTSAERRAARLQRAREFDIFEAAKSAGEEYPYVPADADLKNSPGTTLAYRLPIASAPGWTLFAAVAACLFWNGIASIFVIMAIRGHLRGEPDWFLTVFVIPFMVVGVALVAYVVRQLLITTGVGATRIEISHHPLIPGQQYEILVAQAGRLTMNSLQVVLACDEKATYQQGTDTRTETRRVHQESVFLRTDFEIHPSLPFENRCALCISSSAMHSFKSDHNEVHWKLVVKGDVAGWPDYERSFPVIVYPGNNGVAR